MNLNVGTGWCAPSETDYSLGWVAEHAPPEMWPMGLTWEDIHWLERMLKPAKIDVSK